ncbi:hypothetical protein OS493_013234 [Desmophyllum pertusum]|uniref:Uncharacterized protein n=1 Tax=Desmophyllum pertusum TaxID=174260 RepID=A0A9W9YQG9_9CNID|nr:hypothetical protein OS493_013234 [Desmophyllum pertusum]
MLSTPGCFNHQQWLTKLAEGEQDEKILVSSEREGRSNFLGMFDGEEDIFL